jgi:hypothetical protein
MQWNIGDKARSLSTSNDHTGVIVGIVKAQLWLDNRSLTLFSLWNNKYPGWENGLCIYIKLDKPERSCSLEEYQHFVKKNYLIQPDKDVLTKMYERDVSFSPYVCCPEAAVEKVE